MNLSQRLAQLSPAKRALLEKRLALSATPAMHTPIPAGDASQLSVSEQRLWFVDQLEPEHPFYNLPLAAQLDGPLEIDAFGQALQAVVQRHETLRSTYHMQDGLPHRVIHERVPVRLQVLEPDREDQLRQWLRRDARRSFSLDRPPLLRALLYRLAPQRHVILLVMHHIICDGWSMAVMLRELSAHYAAALSGGPAELPALTNQYRDFAKWQHDRLSEQRLQQELHSARERLNGAPRLLHLPTDYPRPAVQDFEGAIAPFVLSRDASDGLRTMTREYGCTLFPVLLAAYVVFLHRFTDQDDFLVGTVSANRKLPEWESLIGFFVNTLVLRVRSDDGVSFGELVQRAQDAFVSAQEQDEVPLERLVEALTDSRDRSHAPLFQTALVLQNAPRHLAQHSGLRIQAWEVDNGTAKYDLTWFFWEDEGVFRGRVEYRSSLFRAATIGEWLASFERLLQQALLRPAAPISRLSLLTSDQHRRLLGWGRNPVAFQDLTSLDNEIGKWSVRTPAAPAIVAEDAHWTYAELWQRVTAVAAALQRRGLGDQQTVVVDLPRSAAQVASMLGVMRAGWIYVPTDPALPDERFESIIADSRAVLVIGQRHRSANAAAATLSFSQLLAEGGAQQPRPAASDGSRLAYIIYTSGTTGRPKGVAVTHWAITNFVRAQSRKMDVAAADRVLHALSPCFDGGLSEACLGLANGAALVIAAAETVRDPARFADWITRHKVSIGKFPPTLLAGIDPGSCPTLRVVSSAGEALTGELAQRWLPGRRFFNGYGPTEVAVGATMQELFEPIAPHPPIGAPLANLRVYVLDEHQQLVPPMVVGEIYLGGAGVAQGYWNRPDETERVFLRDPFDPANSAARMYRTGDLGRWNREGCLEFCGRVDRQLKLRGYRIEPAAIASKILESPEVEQAYVAVREDGQAGPRLVAYIKAAQTQARSSWRQQQQVANWRSLFRETHRAAPPALDPELNIFGWISSFTGLPLPASEMQAWADEAAQRIRALHPHNVWEIGCGTGMILFRIVDACQRYFGTDFLESSLRQLEANVHASQPGRRSKITLAVREAVDFSDPLPHAIDVAVLNSVVQYFPSAEYLEQVLQGVIERMEVGGRIFLGDVRDLRLLPILSAAVEVHRAGPDTPRTTLLQRIQARIAREEELLINPQFFLHLWRKMPRVAGVDVMLKSSPADNELTRYRYDVVLYLDRAPSRSAVGEPVRYSANAEQGATATEVVAALVRRLPQGGQLIGAPRWRLGEDAEVWRLVHQEHGPATAAQVLQAARQTVAEASAQGWSAAEIPAWSQSLQAELIARPNLASPLCMDLAWSQAGAPPTYVADPAEFDDVGTNRPSSDDWQQDLAVHLKQHLRQTMPDYMIPAAFVCVDALPKTLQGKVDERALPAPPVSRILGQDHVAPTTRHEQLVAEVWERLLDLRPIGVNDDFFELGGHSMLAVRIVAEIERASGRRLPLAALFQHPTVAHLAQLLDAPDPGSSSCLATLQRHGDGFPLYLIHPAGGAVFCYRELASCLPTRPVIGVQAIGLDGRQEPHDNVAAMSEHYIEAILAQQPNGPYHLAGWSLGGNLAFEVARRLNQRGANVGLVALLDAAATPPAEALKEDDFLQLIGALFPNQEALPLDHLRRLPAEEQLKFFLGRASQAGLVPVDNDRVARHIFHVFQSNIKALHQHRTLAYPGRVLLLRAAQATSSHPLGQDPALGWLDFAQGGVDIRHVAGSHTQIVQSPHASTLANILEEAMRQAEQQQAPAL